VQSHGKVRELTRGATCRCGWGEREGTGRPARRILGKLPQLPQIPQMEKQLLRATGKELRHLFLVCVGGSAGVEGTDLGLDSSDTSRGGDGPRWPLEKLIKKE
jgi:hypothetical protein